MSMRTCKKALHRSYVSALSSPITFPLLVGATVAVAYVLSGLHPASKLPCYTTSNLGGTAFAAELCGEYIDVVYTWVNGSDERWLRSMIQHKRALAQPPDAAAAWSWLLQDGAAGVHTATLNTLMRHNDIGCHAEVVHGQMYVLTAAEAAAAATGGNGLNVSQTCVQALARASANFTTTGVVQPQSVRFCDSHMSDAARCVERSTFFTQARAAMPQLFMQEGDPLTEMSTRAEISMYMNRYRDNDELKYSFRSVEKYMPWARNLILVTDGQVPSWLNILHPRIRVVTHAEIFENSDYLPVFSSPAIEVHLHRIPGISKRFVYFNDDVLLGSEVWPSDWIVGPQPPISPYILSPSSSQRVYLSWEVPKCATGCIDSWLGDGFCDVACNTTRCMWDAGDCLPSDGNMSSVKYRNTYNTRTRYGDHAIPSQNLYSNENCAEGCPDSWLGDRMCDVKCNVNDCGWDAGDCGHEQVKSNFPNATASLGLQLHAWNVSVGSDAHILRGTSVFTTANMSRTIAERTQQTIVSLLWPADGSDNQTLGAIRQERYDLASLHLPPLMANPIELPAAPFSGHMVEAGDLAPQLWSWDSLEMEVDANSTRHTYAWQKYVDIQCGGTSCNMTEVLQGAPFTAQIRLPDDKSKKSWAGYVDVKALLHQLKVTTLEETLQRFHWLRDYALNCSLQPQCRMQIAQSPPSDSFLSGNDEVRVEVLSAEMTAPATIPAGGIRVAAFHAHADALVLLIRPGHFLQQAAARTPTTISHPCPSTLPCPNVSVLYDHILHATRSMLAETVHAVFKVKVTIPIRTACSSNCSSVAKTLTSVREYTIPISLVLPASLAVEAPDGAALFSLQNATLDKPIGKVPTLESNQTIYRMLKQAAGAGPLPSLEGLAYRAAAVDLAQFGTGCEDMPRNHAVELLRSAMSSLVNSIFPGVLFASTSGNNSQARRLQDSGDTYGDSLIYTNRLMTRAFGKRLRKAPAHMPHMIDTEVISLLTAKFPHEFESTASHRFRSSSDIQYAFAYFYFLMEGGQKVGINMDIYWQRELDTDGDGMLNDNEFRTLAAVVHRRPPTSADLQALRDCIAPTQTVQAEDTEISEGDVTTTHKMITLTPAITLSRLMQCDLAKQGLAKHVRDAPPQLETGLDEVAFEMITDDYNKTLAQLDSVRARKAKFVCINDDMKFAPAETRQALSLFFESMFPFPSSFELGDGHLNPVLYIDELRKLRRAEAAWQLIMTVCVAVMAGIIAAVAWLRSRQAAPDHSASKNR